MIQTNLIAHGHADLVTHVAYDFYGERLATCSADQKIKLFRRGVEGTWDLEAEWKAHDAPIVHLHFAHPLHGSLLASCSHDRSVRIWEEPSASSSSSATVPQPGGPSGGITAAALVKDGRWQEKGVLSGAKGSVRGVEFGVPDSATGLRVASISTDSHLRLYTSLDPTLSDWSLSHDVHVPSLAPPGAAEDGQGDQQATSTQEAATGGWALSWCKETWWGSVLAVITGTNPTVKIISLDPTPTVILALSPPAGSSPLTSVSWAPSCGRATHHIATGSRDGTVRIWKVTPPEDEGEKEWKGEVVGEFAKGARIGMVDWNATGTVLTVSDDDGIIRIYKATYAKEWKLAGKISAEEPSDEANGH